MDTILTRGPGDETSQSVAAQILKAKSAGLVIDIGDQPVSADIIDRLDGKACRFVFAYGELPVSCEVTPRNDMVELQLLIEVGHIPYTVESRENRERLLDVVKRFNGKCPENFGVEGKQSIFVRGGILLAAPLTATRLISKIVALLFEARPVLESLVAHLPDLAQAIPRFDSNTDRERGRSVPTA